MDLQDEVYRQYDIDVDIDIDNMVFENLLMTSQTKDDSDLLLILGTKESQNVLIILNII